ncbi:SIR2 family NAD-dependent protein deacylase [Vallicoccus soli]|uniref:SIR2 family protein n=1 Tax=Vallicoccus soli TaxID=2339232 RepID=A0A3A3Z4T5_9ACTN|nr:SIR2 family protein [Vallicoccus soli]RJK97958.1 SIR2 family protein [Vallicoccus soli]
MRVDEDDEGAGPARAAQAAAAAPEGADAAHVFVVHGDLSLLACDDVLVPTDAQGRVTRGFAPLLGDALRAGPGGRGHVAAEALEAGGDGLERLRGDGERGTWLVDTASGDVQRLAAQVERFVRAAAARPGGPRHGRAKRLLAMPLVGTGEGGAAGRRGDVIGGLLPLLHRLCAELDVDAALVLADPRDHAAAQEVRRREGRWPLPRGLLDRADELARLATAGRLALFVGAGVSRAAGLPVWQELLDRLAVRAGLGDGEREALAALAPPDAAQLLEGRLGPQGLADELRSLYDRTEHALSHALLAALPVRQVVTTNFDPLLEVAFAGAGRALRLLPGDAPAQGPGEPWLLKVHGDVRRPGDVVLTREGFLRLPEERAALAGVVPSLLLAQHVLFVGFSLLDDTFIRAAHQVRRLREEHGGPPVGTALALREEPLRQELWAQDLTQVSLGGATTPLPAAARRLEVLLDRVAASSTPRSGWLLDDRYAALRSPQDAALAGALARLRRELPEEATGSPAWEEVRALLEDGLGGCPPGRRGGAGAGAGTAATAVTQRDDR